MHQVSKELYFCLGVLFVFSKIRKKNGLKQQLRIRDTHTLIPGLEVGEMWGKIFEFLFERTMREVIS